MTQEHFIPGKAASLEQSIAAMQAGLAAHGFELEESGWLNPVNGVWSVHLHNRACALMVASGKGSSQLAARASALGEFIERLACKRFWRDYFLGDAIANDLYAHDSRERWFPVTGLDWPAELLTPELQAFYNPEGSIHAETLIDFNTGHYGRGICALPYVRLRDGAEVFFPVNIVDNLYVGNGMAAGNTPDEAHLHALVEILERYVKFKVIGEGLCLPDVPEDVMTPEIAGGLAELRAAGFGILVKDASLGGRYPVLCVTLLNPRDQGVSASFGAHPCFAVALERALAELLQGRTLDTLDGFPPPGLDLDEAASAANRANHFAGAGGIVHWNFFQDAGEFADFDFVDWNAKHSAEPAAEQFKRLSEGIHADGHDIYLADFDSLGMHACRIVIPGMSEIHPVDKLEWENNSHGAVVRPAILNLAELDDAQCGQLLDIIAELDIADAQPVATLIGLAPDDGSMWADLRVGELKTMLALAMGDTRGIIEGCAWIDRFGQIDADRRRVYRCIETLLEMADPNACEEALLALYGETTLDLASDLIDGDIRFFGLASPGFQLEDCVLHGQLLAEYAKCHSHPE